MIPKRIDLTFQGGFAGTRCIVELAEGGRPWRLLTRIYPEDVNRKQTFEIAPGDMGECGVDSVKIVFEESSDFFGRITVYDLQLLGIIPV